MIGKNKVIDNKCGNYSCLTWQTIRLYWVIKSIQKHIAPFNYDAGMRRAPVGTRSPAERISTGNLG